jgi:hypothetical protein
MHFSCQLRKQDMIQLNCMMKVNIPSMKNLERTLRRRSNGIKQVCCHRFIKYIDILNALLLVVAKIGHLNDQFNVCDEADEGSFSITESSDQS